MGVDPGSWGWVGASCFFECRTGGVLDVRDSGVREAPFVGGVRVLEGVGR